jgi:hypothetical protein
MQIRFIKPAILLAALLTGCQQQKAPEETRAPQPVDNPSAAPAAAQIAGTPADTVMTPEYVATVGRVAYIWGLAARQQSQPLHRHGFWSISVYNAKGYFEPNPHNTYSINNITAQKNADGSFLGGIIARYRLFA